MKVKIYIKEGDRVIEWDRLTDKQKKEYGQKLNEQALTALGYKKSQRRGI